MKTSLAVCVAGFALLGFSVARAEGSPEQPTRSRTGWFEREDLNADGRVTLTEAQAAALSWFARLDANGDGSVARDEVDAGARRWRQERCSARLTALDRNRDGRLSARELAWPPRRLARADRDGDGALDPAELWDAGRRGPGGDGEEAALRASIWRRDLDRDGRVTRVEALAAAERRFVRKDHDRDGVLTRDESATE